MGKERELGGEIEQGKRDAVARGTWKDTKRYEERQT